MLRGQQTALWKQHCPPSHAEEVSGCKAVGKHFVSVAHLSPWQSARLETEPGFDIGKCGTVAGASLSHTRCQVTPP